MNGRNRRLTSVGMAQVVMLAVAGCGGGMTITYQVGGSASQAEVAHKDGAGAMQSLEASLPWQTTIKAGKEFAFDLEAAVAEFGESVALDLESVTPYGNLGIVCIQLERYEEGIAASQEALRLDPEHADLHDNLALAYAKAGHPEDAIIEYEKAIGLASDMFDAHKSVGYVYADQGRTAEAITALERYLEVRPVD